MRRIQWKTRQNDGAIETWLFLLHPSPLQQATQSTDSEFKSQLFPKLMTLPAFESLSSQGPKIQCLVTTKNPLAGNKKRLVMKMC